MSRLDPRFADTRQALPEPGWPLTILGVAAAIVLVAPAAKAQCTEGCTAIHTLEGEAAGDQFGWVSNDIGDLDHDGIRDFVITAPTNDAGGASAGRCYVYSGASGDELWRVTGLAPSWWLGHDAIGAGDIDGDGTPDVVAGAPNGGTGRAIIYSGVDGTPIHTFNGAVSGDQFGYRVWGDADFDGDGHPDIAIGARHHDSGGANAGRAYVYSGTDFSLICAIDGAAGDRFGSGVAFVGDVNGDGRDDLAVGAMDAGAFSGGLGYVYSWDGNACVELYVLDPATTATNFGHWFMNGGHDVNADGTPDIYVNDFPQNRAHIFSGVDGDKIWTLTGDNSGGFGIGRIVNDVDGDCHADMILAAWASSAGAPQGGKAFVYSGRLGVPLDTYTHNVSGANFGFDANGMGDVDGDGKFDYLITAASDLSGRGRAYVIAGEITTPRVGDVNGNGTTDMNDLLVLLAIWGPCPPPPTDCLGDFVCDGEVDFHDLLALLANWGS